MKRDPCPACEGTGNSGFDLPCAHCDGTGKGSDYRRVNRRLFGFLHEPKKEEKQHGKVSSQYPVASSQFRQSQSQRQRTAFDFTGYWLLATDYCLYLTVAVKMLLQHCAYRAQGEARGELLDMLDRLDCAWSGYKAAEED